MLDYIELGMLTLTLQPGQMSVLHDIPIVNDDVTEMDQETFMLSLQPQTSRVVAPSGFNSSVVTITDDDSKLCHMWCDYELRLCYITTQV